MPIESTTTTEALTRSVVFHGHLIDSLTLSKVIDRIQQMGGDYQINDIRIGNLKKDVSSLHLSLSAPSQEVMNALLEALKDYGATFEEGPAETVTCDQAGVLPDKAYKILLPQQVYYNNQWIPVQGGGPWTLVIQANQAKLIPAGDLKTGDRVIRDTNGLAW